MAEFGDLLRGIAAVLWVVLAIGAFRVFRVAIKERIPTLTKLGLTPAGVSMEFAEQKLEEATTRAATHAEPAVGHVARHAVLARVERNADILQRARVLWVDDYPDNNMPIVELLRHFGAVVDLPQNSSAALALLASARFDVVISDLNRAEDGPLAGLNLAEEIYRKYSQQTIIFTMTADPMTALLGDNDARSLEIARAVQRSTSGYTTSFDEVLHLALDQLERRLV